MARIKKIIIDPGESGDIESEVRKATDILRQRSIMPRSGVRRPVLGFVTIDVELVETALASLAEAKIRASS